MNRAQPILSEPTSSFPWKPVLIRCALFVGGGIAGLILATAVVLALSISLGDGTVQGGPLIAPLFTLIPIAGITGGVFLTGWFERRKNSGPFPGNTAAVAAAQKVLLVCVLFQFLAIFIRSGVFVPVYWFLGTIGAFLMTFALGFRKREQVLWIATIGLAGMVRWTGGIMGRDNINPIAIFYLTIFGLLVGLVIMLRLNKRATKSLREAGLNVGFMGVPVQGFPAIDFNSAQKPEDSIETTPSEAGSAESLPATPVMNLYYLGPNNESIGPISSDVLLQLRASAVVTGETLVAPVGDSEWKPLRTLFEDA